MLNASHESALRNKAINFVTIVVATILLLFSAPSSFATTKGLSQIVTPDLQGEGDLSLSFQIQDKRIANPYQLQAEMGLTKWAEVAVFRGFQPDEWIFGTEIGLLTKQSGSENSSAIGFTCNVTPDFQFNPALYVNNGPKHDLFGYIVFTYTFHLWRVKSGKTAESPKGLSKK